MSEPTDYDVSDLQLALDFHEGTGPGLPEDALTSLPASDVDFVQEDQA